MTEKLYEYYENTTNTFYHKGDWLLAQTFTVGITGSEEDFEVTKVSVNIDMNSSYLYDYITLNANIYETDNAGSPEMSSLLSSGTITVFRTSTGKDWEDISMSPSDLTNGSKYALVFDHSSTTYPSIGYSYKSSSATYGGSANVYLASSDSGSTWELPGGRDDADMAFRVYGDDGAFTGSDNIFSKSRITIEGCDSETWFVNVTPTPTETITGYSSVEIIEQETITGYSSIEIENEETITGYSSIEETKTETISGLSGIKAEQENTDLVSKPIVSIIGDTIFGETEKNPPGAEMSNTDQKLVSKFTTDRCGIIKKGYAVLQMTAGSTVARHIIYTDSSGSPGDLIAYSDESEVSGIEDYISFTYSGSQQKNLDPDTDYWVGVHWKGSSNIVYTGVLNNTDESILADDTYSDGSDDPFGAIYTESLGPIVSWVELQAETQVINSFSYISLEGLTETITGFTHIKDIFDANITGFSSVEITNSETLAGYSSVSILNEENIFSKSVVQTTETETINSQSYIERLPVQDGLVLNLDATAISGKTDEDLLETWSDVSGEGYDASQTTEARRPKYKEDVFYGKPAVEFDPTSGTSISTDSSLNIGSSYTAFAVVYPTNQTGLGDYSTYGFTIMAPSSGYAAWTLLRQGEIKHYAYTNSTTTYGITSGENVFNNRGTVISIDATRNTIDGAHVYRDSNLALTHNANNDGWAGYFTVGDLRNGRSICFEGYVGEIVLYNRVLNSTEREEVEQYLMDKWLGYVNDDITGFSHISKESEEQITGLSFIKTLEEETIDGYSSVQETKEETIEGYSVSLRTENNTKDSYSVIKQTNTENIEGFSSVEVLKEQTLTGYSVIETIGEENIYSYSSIEILNSEEITGFSSVEVLSEGLITGKSVVLRTEEENIDSKSVIQTINTETIEGYSVSKQTEENIIYEKSHIKRTSEEEQIFSESWISDTNSENIYSKTHIQRIEEENLDSYSSIEKIYTEDITGYSNIFKVNSYNLTGYTVVGVETSGIITGYSNIFNTLSEDITGYLSIYETNMFQETGYSVIVKEGVTNNISGKSIISRTEDNQITGISSIENINSELYTGYSWILEEKEREIYSYSVIKITETETKDGFSHILNTITDIITGYSSTSITPETDIYSYSVITRTEDSNIYGKSVVSLTNDNNIFGYTHVFKELTEEISGLSHIQKTETETIYGKSSVQITYDEIIKGYSHISLTDADHIFGYSNILVTYTEHTHSKSIIKRIRTNIKTGYSTTRLTLSKDLTGYSATKKLDVTSTIYGKTVIWAGPEPLKPDIISSKDTRPKKPTLKTISKEKPTSIKTSSKKPNKIISIRKKQNLEVTQSKPKKPKILDSTKRGT